MLNLSFFLFSNLARQTKYQLDETVKTAWKALVYRLFVAHPHKTSDKISMNYE